MKLPQLAEEIGISSLTLKKFIEDFDLKLDDCIFPSLDVKPEFEKFATENAEFLKKYEADLLQQKSPEEIAATISQPVDKINEILNKVSENIFDNGYFKSSVSSFGIDHKLGGNYQFIYDYFGQKTALAHRNFIGYRDLFFYITEVLQPFINPAEAKNWGIRKPAGILLYGPPGSGKIFWAKKIAEIIGYKLKEIRKNYFISKNSGESPSFNDFLLKMMDEDKVLLFVEHFDEIMARPTPNFSPSQENLETQEIILQNISKFEQESLLMVGAAISLADIDEEFLAPGRFDILIPIFPPNQEERAEIIRYYMFQNLDKNATLYQILERSGADHIPFWQEISAKMKVFSNTMLIDFTQSLKKRIKSRFQMEGNPNLLVDRKLLESAFRDASAKLTNEYLNQIGQFLADVSLNNADEFTRRIATLKQELDSYKIPEKPRREIGFEHNSPD